MFGYNIGMQGYKWVDGYQNTTPIHTSDFIFRRGYTIPEFDRSIPPQFSVVTQSTKSYRWLKIWVSSVANHFCYTHS